MLGKTRTRLAQGHRTVKYPAEAPVMPDRFRGLPIINPSRCKAKCEGCTESCPAKAIYRQDGEVILDMGKCIFCRACERACGGKAIRFTSEYSIAARNRSDLLLKGSSNFKLAGPLDNSRLRLFRKSISLRHVSAGDCNACGLDVNVLNTIVFDLSRFGIQFVASPRHADGLLVTGPVTNNMELALRKTYAATPQPRIVIAVGTCAISGGMFSEHKEVHRGVDELLPVDLYIPGCPPHPYTILDGLLRLIGKI